jgi:hypothetical protein
VQHRRWAALNPQGGGEASQKRALHHSASSVTSVCHFAPKDSMSKHTSETYEYATDTLDAYSPCRLPNIWKLHRQDYRQCTWSSTIVPFVSRNAGSPRLLMLLVVGTRPNYITCDSAPASRSCGTNSIVGNLPVEVTCRHKLINDM